MYSDCRERLTRQLGSTIFGTVVPPFTMVLSVLALIFPSLSS